MDDSKLVSIKAEHKVVKVVSHCVANFNHLIYICQLSLFRSHDNDHVR